MQTAAYNQDMPRRPKEKTDDDSNFARDFASALEAYKRSENLSAVALAKRLGVEETTLGRYLRAEIAVGGVVLARALTVLGIRIPYAGFLLTADGADHRNRLDQVSWSFDESDRLEIMLERRRPNSIELSIRRAT